MSARHLYTLRNEGRNPRLVYAFNHRAVEIPARPRNGEAKVIQVELLDGNAVQIRRLEINGGALKIEGADENACAVLERAHTPVSRSHFAPHRPQTRINGQPKREEPRPVHDAIMHGEPLQEQSPATVGETHGGELDRAGDSDEQPAVLQDVGEPGEPARPRSTRRSRR